MSYNEQWGTPCCFTKRKANLAFVDEMARRTKVSRQNFSSSGKSSGNSAPSRCVECRMVYYEHGKGESPWPFFACSSDDFSWGYRRLLGYQIQFLVAPRVHHNQADRLENRNLIAASTTYSKARERTKVEVSIHLMWIIVQVFLLAEQRGRIFQTVSVHFSLYLTWSSPLTFCRCFT